MARDRDEDAKRRIDVAERRSRELEVDLNRLNAQHKTLFDRGLNQKDSEGKMRELEIDHKSLENRSKQLEDQLTKA